MNLRPVVKLMNFHALMRVDSSKKLALRQRNLERSLTNIMDVCMNNRNFILDKYLMTADTTKPPLHIYIGSDLGFCGAFNHRVSAEIAKDPGALKIVIGNKLSTAGVSGVVYKCGRAECEDHYDRIRRMVLDSLTLRKCSSIVLVYNKYLNASNSELLRQEVFPMTHEFDGSANEDTRRYRDDFVVEGDTTYLLMKMVSTYVEYEMRIALNSSYASENCMRQEITDQSLEKLDELEEQVVMQKRSERRRKEFNSVVETYSRLGQG